MNEEASQAALFADDVASIGARISSLREARGLNRTQLAARVGTTDSALSQMERGKAGAPRFEVGVRIAKELGVTPWYLLTGERLRGEADNAQVIADPAKRVVLPEVTVAQVSGLIEQLHEVATEMRRGSVALAEMAQSCEQSPHKDTLPNGSTARRKRAS